MTVHTHSLSRDEVIRFHNEGFLGPLKACSPAEMAQTREHIDRDVLPASGPDPARNEHARHLDMKVVYDLVSHPAIVGRLQSILGANIVIWSSNFWNKEPGGAEIPWHQDINFWPIEPLVNVSSWIAIDEVTTENACVQIIPGSHRAVLPHVPAREEMAFEEEVDPDKVDISSVINMELAPGEFFLFNERTLHHSEVNRSDKRRLGLAARYTIPLVKVLDQDGPPLFPGHRCVLLTGEDPMRLNRMATAPHV